MLLTLWSNKYFVKDLYEKLNSKVSILTLY